MRMHEFHRASPGTRAWARAVARAEAPDSLSGVDARGRAASLSHFLCHHKTPRSRGEIYGIRTRRDVCRCLACVRRVWALWLWVWRRLASAVGVARAAPAGACHGAHGRGPVRLGSVPSGSRGGRAGGAWGWRCGLRLATAVRSRFLKLNTQYYLPVVL